MNDPPSQNGTGLSAIPYSGESSGPNFTDLFVVTGDKRPEVGMGDIRILPSDNSMNTLIDRRMTLLAIHFTLS
jgi:hypothetical protein